MRPQILTLPGLGATGPQHWMSLWEGENPETCFRVQQGEWDEPVCAEWVDELERAVAPAGPERVLVAHSLGCHLVVHWAQRTKLRVRGALLVAPPDLQSPAMPPGSIGFAPLPQIKLPFKSIVVASRNDPYCTLAEARAMAATWGAQFFDAGSAGHINVASGHGRWPEGKTLLAELLA
jgi:uncharacterized protein